MSDNDLQNSLVLLKMLVEALTLPRSLDEALEHITTATCKLMETEQAVFLLRDEERGELMVKSAVGMEKTSIRTGNDLNVHQRLKNILWNLKNIHRINWNREENDNIGFPILCAPITVKGARVGILATGAAKNIQEGTRPFNAVRQNLFAIIAPFASLVIENAKVYELLRQHFAITSAALRQGSENDTTARNDAEQVTVNSIGNQTRVVKILAESFFKELKRAGVQDSHVAIAASQMLECIVAGNQK